MHDRGYQNSAIDGIFDAWESHASTLLVMPTGTGKTVTFAKTIARRQKRVMVIAHREELINQAAATIERVTGEPCEIEMAHQRADGNFLRRSRVVVASKDSLHKKRLEKFDPSEFDTVIIDEAHHAVAKSYQRIIAYFRRNPDLKVLGVTATPDRLDERALGIVFESVAFVYEILDAIDDGYLVPIEQRTVAVDSLDFTNVHTQAGDFNQKELAQLMEFEKNLHAIADPVLRLSRWKRTLLFAASIKHADRLTEIFNRRRPGCARFVHGGTPKDERKLILQDYREGRFQYLCNVGVFTEGFDDPGIGMVAIARPTKSRALYAQMIGRGTRPLPGLIDGLASPEDRRAAIMASQKPVVEVLDFEGQAGTHKLVTSADILGGDYENDVIDLAKELISKSNGEKVDTVQALKDAARIRHEEKREAAEIEARRRNLVGVADFRTRGVDPFDILDIDPPRMRSWDRESDGPTDAQLGVLQRMGVPTEGLNKRTASKLIGECIQRREKNLCTFKQLAQLKKHGIDGTEMSFQDASAQLDRIFSGRGPRRVVSA